MATATRLPTDMCGWAPVTRHYEVDGGHLAVTMLDFWGATGTQVFYADERGAAISMTPLLELPAGTTYSEALESMGYTVVDTVGAEQAPVAEPEPQAVEQSVLEMLPPEIAAAITTATGGEQ